MRKVSMSVAAALAMCLAAPAFAQSVPKELARNFEGVWTNATVTRLERSANYKDLVVPKEQADAVEKATVARQKAANAPSNLSGGAFKDANSVAGYNSFWIDSGDGLMRVRGEARSSLITSPADGKMPFRDRAKSLALMTRDSAEYNSGKGAYAGPEDLPIRERCIIAQSDAGGPVMLNALYNNNYSFLLMPNYFVIELEMNHDARVIPIFETAEKARASFKPAIIRPWLGDSVAWWEGDTLVAETRNINAVQESRTLTPVSPRGVVTERFTRIAQGELLYEFKVDDPGHYTQAWTGEYSFKPAKGRIYEYACHEGNYSMAGILGGARLEEEAAAKAAAAAKPVKRGKSKR